MSAYFFIGDGFSYEKNTGASIDLPIIPVKQKPLVYTKGFEHTMFIALVNNLIWMVLLFVPLIMHHIPVTSCCQ